MYILRWKLEIFRFRRLLQRADYFCCVGMQSTSQKAAGLCGSVVRPLQCLL
jgi:hypothetical protein